MNYATPTPIIHPKSGKAKQLVVFLHGYGADGNDLIDIGQQWQKTLPDAEFISPHAPEPCAMSPMGRQWFPLTMRDPNERWLGVNQAEKNLQNYLDDELKKRELTNAQLALIGFSQGGMMALHVGLRRKTAPSSIISYSGAFILPPANPLSKLEMEKLVKPPILLVHGDQDEVIPVSALTMSRDALLNLGIPCTTHISHNVGHGIDSQGLQLGATFLAKNFAL
jgi:phospholipase/carboxylesterase